MLKDKSAPEAINPPMFIEKDKVEKIMVYSDMLYREIALRTDSMAYYDRVVMSGKGGYSNLKNLLKHSYVYNADMDVSDRYIKYFNEEYESDLNYQLHKCFFDIEVDLRPNGFRDKGYIGFPDEAIAPCPVNIITLVDGKTLQVHSFICRHPDNIELQNFEANISEEKEKMRQFILDRHELIVNGINVEFFNSEEETIEAFFRLVHNIDPDVMLA